MTVKVAGYWDLWFSHRESEFDISWRFMLKHFAVDEVILMPDLGTCEKISLDDSEVALVEMADVHELLAANSHLTPVLVDERGTTHLHDFQHPTDALYIFGRTGGNPWDQLPDWTGATVLVESAPEQMNTSAWLHPNQACSIVLYDRLAKSWQ